MKVLDFALVFALCGAPFVVAGTIGHGNNPKSDGFVYLLGDASPLSSNEWNLIYAVDPDFAVILSQMLTPLSVCGDEAVRVCGDGDVCWVCVYRQNGIEACSYACRASDGSCEPAPPCGSAMDY